MFRLPLGSNYVTEVNGRLTLQLLIAPALLLLTYIVYRAAALSFTLDESTTWLYYGAPSGFFPDSPDSNLANHHLLNTWLMKLCSIFFGTSEFALRMPNVLAGGGYLIASIAFAMKFPPVRGVLFFIAMTCHPYILQYFSMARGYGLAITFLFSGLFLAWQYWEESKSVKLLVGSLLLMVAAVGANLSTVDFVLPFFGLQFLLLLFSGTNRNRVHLIISFIAMSVITVLVWLHGNYLEKYHALHWGGTEGIWSETISSLCGSLSYDASYSINIRAMLRLFLEISCGIIVIGSIWNLFRIKERSTMVPLLSGSLLFTLAFILILHYWRGTLFPLGRTALFLVPLFIMTLMLTLNHFGNIMRRFTVIYSSFFCVALVIHLIMNANFRQTMEWYYEADSKQVALDLHELDPEGKQTLYTDWLLDGTMNYYRTRFTFSRQGFGENGKPTLDNDWALVDVWRHGYPDPMIWKMHRCYINNLILFKKRTVTE